MCNCFPQTSPKVSFPKVEEDILAFWKKNDTFHQSIKQREDAGAKDYVFYDGPPFATGLPHYGHILTSYIKDTVPRFFTMKGFRVDRRFGWDCHGLPIENEIERELEINGKQAIEAYGIDKFNKSCSEVVLRYTKEWEDVITRLGRWVDFDRDYKTMDLDYMESVMNVFWQLFEKGLIYEGDKVVPYCYRCQTPLSNFEARLDDSFRARQDPSVTVRFRVKNSDLDGEEYILAWTTTPWTLPSNMGLAVGAEIDYVLLKNGGDHYWMAAARVEAFKKELKDAEEVKRVKGSELVGKIYEPLMPYFAEMESEGAFRVVVANFVTTEDGTGIVHIAPAFGEDDYELGLSAGLPRTNPVDSRGCFDERVTDFAGLNVHDANKEIIRWLKENGKLIRQETIDHNYPHCWRDDTPLIYKTVPTWYVNVTKVKEDMLEANQKINWVPSHIRDGRFGSWLANARDWAVSRSRFWGAPIPIWRCDKTDELYVPGSVAELSEKWGQPVTNLHRPFIDEVTFPSPAGGTFRRVPEVLDCWFESGSMPYAQVHYPFEQKQWFDENFPADFIVEYIAQTRGWFYTLVVLSAALKKKPPFSNCICHGVVLAEDGRKMSKRLKNYPDPMEVVNKYGSDSLRIALLSSPVVRGGNLRFTEKDVEESMRSFMIPFWNAYHFFTTYANIDGWKPEMGREIKPFNRTDRYILAKLEDVKAKLVKYMESYDIVGAYESLVGFTDQVNNWFIRLSRRRFWEDGNDESKLAAYSVLYQVLKELSMISAPFTPFIAEEIYQGLCGQEKSVHLADWPEAHPEFDAADLVHEVETVQKVIYMGRQIREARNVKGRQPLRTVQVAGIDQSMIDAYKSELVTELNVKEVLVLENPEGVVLPVYKLNAKVLGPKFGKDFKNLMGAARKGEVELNDDGTATVAGHTILAEEFTIDYQTSGDQVGCVASGKLIVLLSLELDEELIQEGFARELIRLVQVFRKDIDLEYTDRIALMISTEDEDLSAAVTKHKDWISGEVLATSLTLAASDNGFETTEVKIKGNNVTLAIKKN